MDFRFSEDEEMLRQKVRAFAEEMLAPLAPEVDEKDEVSWELVKLMAGQDLFRLVAPEEYGGLGMKAVNNCIVRDELCRICVHADLYYAEQLLTAYPISVYGTEEQKRKYLPPLACGEKVGSFALTEPDAGSDVAGMKSTAVLEGDHYVLNGNKCFASMGPFAQTYVTFARTDPSKGSKGISAFIVEQGTPGFEGRPMRLMGPHPMGELTFTDCRVPRGNLLGQPGKGMEVALSTLDCVRMSVGASAIGIARRALEEAVSYSKQRVAFGKPIAEFQSTQFKLAEMALDIDAAELLVFRAAWLKDETGGRVTRETAMAKLFATEMACRVVDQALQLHGGYGVVKGMTVERLYRAVRQPRLYEGTTEIQKIVIARQILSG
ncbi:MAG: acyl-CoA dehydrogenase family protein [Dehalococcoidia bacterium]|nr:acyl-CoA dehydrogenase family protein [Dehalococcoidia bacterium]MDD5494581.1 acyl-CoA dehydrogenase family protein [Dehalococcoidia bacterium]